MMDPKTPRLTVDAVILENDSVLLIKRANEPFKGMWALPGGFVDYGETVENAVVREAKEETCLDIEIEGLLDVYSDPQRDPRGHTISIAFICKPVEGKPAAGSDAAEAKYFKMGKLPELAFDHKKIIEDAKVILDG